MNSSTRTVIPECISLATEFLKGLGLNDLTVEINSLGCNTCRKEYKEELAMIIEEVLRQRTKGVKDRKGRIISPLFPKLLYWICDGLNVEPTDPYYYLNELAVDCVVKRMQPDIVSEKKSREMKEGQIIPCMGAVRGDEIVSIKINEILEVVENDKIVVPNYGLLQNNGKRANMLVYIHLVLMNMHMQIKAYYIFQLIIC